MIRAQKRHYDEVLFFDDSSTDGTAHLIESAGFTVLRGAENRGAAHARNRLLAATSADYVHFHDVDDELDPRFVESLLPYVGKNQAACCAFRRRWPDGRTEREDRLRDLPTSPPDRIRYLTEHFLTFNAAIYPRTALLELEGFEETLRIHEDLHLLLRLAASNLAFVYHDQILTTWQLRANSTYHSTDERAIAVQRLNCLGDLCRRWSRTTRRALGPALMEIAWQFHIWGDASNALHAARLARVCGQRSIRSRGRRILWLSKLLGPVLYYRLFAASPIAEPMR